MAQTIARLTALALLAIAGHAQGQTINFGVSEGLVDSIQLQDLSFTSTAAYSASSIQFRVFDLYPEGTPFMGAKFGESGISFTIDSVDQPLSSFAITAQGNLGGSGNTDTIYWLDFNEAISFAPGSTISLSGFGAVTSMITTPLAEPLDGTFTGYFVNSSSGDTLSDSVQINVAAVPEPSTYALGLGAAGLLAAGLRRRTRKQD